MIVFIIVAIIGYFLGFLTHMNWLEKKIKKGYFEYNNKTYIIRDEKDFKWMGDVK
ncbi:MAG: hypothetical protein ACYS76_09730 [Planctomycetota bacterium]